MLNRREMLAATAATTAGFALPNISKAVPLTKGKRDAQELFNEIRKEKLEIYRKWKDPWLKNVYHEKGNEFAVALDNQRCFTNSHRYTPFESINITNRVLQQSATPDLVSVQSMLGPGDVVFYYHPDGTLDYEMLGVYSKMLRVDWLGEVLQKQLKNQFNLDAREELRAVLSQEIALEMDREVIHDLCISANTYRFHQGWRTVSEGDFTKYAANVCEEQSKRISKRNGSFDGLTRLFWIITSPKIAGILTERGLISFSCTPHSTLAVHRIGYLKYTFFMVYVDPLFPRNRILFGQKLSNGTFQKRKHYKVCSGYIYAPYVPLAFYPKDNGRYAIMSRYGKKLINQDYYTRMDL